MLKLIYKKHDIISLKEHFLRKNKVLIKRRIGGIGDILMQRMMFEDFKNQFPHLEFSWAVPQKYTHMAKNHPYTDTIEINAVKNNEFGAIYDITIACTKHETRTKNNQINRCDIWANYCGIKCHNHNMFIESNENLINEFKSIFKKLNPENKPIVLISSQSTDDDVGISKSLNEQQITEIIAKIKNLGYYPCTIHNKSQSIYEKLNIDQFIELKFDQWIAVICSVDYIISVDTATFHLAGGLRKPLIGIFSFTDGKVYGKYYDFILVQKHRDNGDWDCGPCFKFAGCVKCKKPLKPCLTELSKEEIQQGILTMFKKWPINN